MPKEVDQQLQAAFSLHQAGKLDKAASIYREIVDKDADNFYALQYLGVIEASLGHFLHFIIFWFTAFRLDDFIFCTVICEIPQIFWS